MAFSEVPRLGSCAPGASIQILLIPVRFRLTELAPSGALLRPRRSFPPGEPTVGWTTPRCLLVEWEEAPIRQLMGSLVLCLTRDVAV